MQQPMFDRSLLKGKIALVTGSTAGIGAATATQLAGAGADAVVLNARTASDGEALKHKLQGEFPQTRFEFVGADYNKPGDVAAMFDRVQSLFGGLDIFIHPGMGEGGGGPMPFMETDPAHWQTAVHGILLSFVHCCRRAVPLMLARGGGSIVSYASDAAKIPTPGEAVLGAALAGNVMFAKVLALELGRQNIRVNVVTPSITRNTRTYDRVMAGGFSKRLFEKAESRARLGVASAENVAMMAVFLASPMASHVTGQVVSVNGGISVA